mmetsp:Transcript_117368/g.339329  ORF Transcript_117368/g.339329 Transcript_117368/m.339329 type:complete len:206 (+) Transcript_117368:152-769(+)
MRLTSKGPETRRRKLGRWRNSDHRRLAALKAAPMRPPRTPNSAKATCSTLELPMLNCTLKSVRPCSEPFNTERKSAAAAAAVKALTKVFVGKLPELTSSRLKSTPPNGAPKAAETPAAAAAENNSLRLASFWNCTKIPESNCAQHTATCTKGPSFPNDRPAATESTKPGILTSKVRKATASGMTKPFKIVFTSGIPEPTAAGAKR